MHINRNTSTVRSKDSEICLRGIWSCTDMINWPRWNILRVIRMSHAACRRSKTLLPCILLSWKAIETFGPYRNTSLHFFLSYVPEDSFLNGRWTVFQKYIILPSSAAQESDIYPHMASDQGDIGGELTILPLLQVDSLPLPKKHREHYSSRWLALCSKLNKLWRLIPSIIKEPSSTQKKKKNGEVTPSAGE